MLVLIIFLGIILRVITLGHESVDGDELFSRRVALLPIDSMLDTVRNDLVHPPLYYLLLKIGVSTLGASVIGIRLVSLVFGIATVALVAGIGILLPGARHAGLIAAALLALNEYHIFYSQQARSYALYTFLAGLLLCWVAVTAERAPSTRSWVAGYVLMVLLVYTHYVGAIYVFWAVVALLVCSIPRRTKIFTLLVSGLAALTFVPWLITEVPIYHSKHGIDRNLAWQGHPGFQALKQLWAVSIGVMDFNGATTLAFGLGAVLALAALKIRSPQRPLGDMPVLVTLASLATLPVLSIFFLSVWPFNLPLFGIRHLLPSIVFLSLLCCHGLENLALRSGRFYGQVIAVGSLVLLVFALVPSFTRLANGPSRYPYDRIAKDIRLSPGIGRQVYTTWYYGIGEPVNYYCAAKCVEPLPAGYSVLPQAIVLLYRPRAPKEAQRYKDLLKEGFAPDSNPVYYTDGRQSPWGTSLVLLTRRGTRPGGN